MAFWLRRVWRAEPFIAVAIVSLTVLLSYAPLIPWLGFYWDDWFWRWVAQAEGQQGLIFNQSTDRPLAWVSSVPLSPLLGANVLLWHITSLTMRWAGAVVFLWGLRGLWPKQRFPTLAAALLFAVYPGFLQQPLSSYWGWHYAVLLGVFSLAATVRAERSASQAISIGLTAVALLAGLLYLLKLEFLIGLEGLRLLLLWYGSGAMESLSGRARVAYVLRRWLPYLVTVAGFLTWRLFLFTSTRATTDVRAVASTYLENPLKTLLKLPIEAFRDFLESTVLAWFVPAGARLSSASSTLFVLSLFAGLIGLAFVLLYYRWLGHREMLRGGGEPKDAHSVARDLLVIGILAVFSALVPMLLVGRQVELLGGAGSIDRYTLPTVMGVSLTTVGAIHFLVDPRLGAWVLASLVGFSIATHISNANIYREGWQVQRNLWWQLSWRAPQLEAGTVLVLQSPGMPHSPADYDIWGAANMAYNFEERKTLVWGLPLDEDVAQSIRMGEKIDKVMRKVTFQADMRRSLVLAMPSAFSCLRVLDGGRMELPVSADSLLRSVAPYSRIDLIRVNPSLGRTNATPPSEVFGKEPARGWCYYFEKAELARQMGDWRKVAQLGDEAGRLGFGPTDATEWLPFVEGYANLGRYDEARALVKRAVEALPRARRYDETGDKTQGMPVLRESLCGLRDRLGSAKSPDPARAAFIAQLGADVTCSYK